MTVTDQRAEPQRAAHQVPGQRRARGASIVSHCLLHGSGRYRRAR
jgi:hypothetical protein